MVGVVSGLIDGGGIPKLAQYRESKLMEVIEAVVEGDRYSLVWKTAIAEHSQRLIERKDLIA